MIRDERSFSSKNGRGGYSFQGSPRWNHVRWSASLSRRLVEMSSPGAVLAPPRKQTLFSNIPAQLQIRPLQSCSYFTTCYDSCLAEFPQR